jgi:Mlc titration factor MtfA (ptsG expression regulator)
MKAIKPNLKKGSNNFCSRLELPEQKTNVEDLDRVLIAASAIIPIFNFPGWQYVHLHEVLLYPDSLDHEF